MASFRAQDKEWYVHYKIGSDNRGSRKVNGVTKKQAIQNWENYFQQPNQTFISITLYKVLQ